MNCPSLLSFDDQTRRKTNTNAQFFFASSLDHLGSVTIVRKPNLTRFTTSSQHPPTTFISHPIVFLFLIFSTSQSVSIFSFFLPVRCIATLTTSDSSLLTTRPNHLPLIQLFPSIRPLLKQPSSYPLHTLNSIFSIYTTRLHLVVFIYTILGALFNFPAHCSSVCTANKVFCRSLGCISSIIFYVGNKISKL